MTFNIWDKTIKIVPTGLKKPPWSGYELKSYRVTISKGDIEHEFDFYDSFYHTFHEPKEIPEELASDILVSITLDWDRSPDDPARLFVESLKISLKELQDHIPKVINHLEKLHQLFTPQEIEKISEFEDQLDQLITNLRIYESQFNQNT